MDSFSKKVKEVIAFFGMYMRYMEFGFLFFRDFNLVIFVFDLKPTIQLELKGSTVVSLYWYHFFGGMNTAKNTNNKGITTLNPWCITKNGGETHQKTHKKKYTKSQNFHCWIPPRNFVFFTMAGAEWCWRKGRLALCLLAPKLCYGWVLHVMRVPWCCFFLGGDDGKVLGF